MIDSTAKVAQIRINFKVSTGYLRATYTDGFEFLNKQGKSILKVGPFTGDITKVAKVEENENVIGIKAQIRKDPTSNNHGKLYNLQFIIASPT
jgi:hypothetical protein